jgi:Urb2/Npa2 family
MILNIRGVRPLLGSKQYRFVADTFPRWINPINPLGEAEARSLSRLLTAFTTKSIVRSHSGDTQKADSLARPFARHAPYVLLSYLQLMNDPLSVLSAGMRHELEPGLFALCAMMGENGRDTLMVQSLDIGGKAMLKSLWKEYDRQRYIGRG